MLDFLVLAHECAPSVNPQILQEIVRVESNFNPYAIGVVGGQLKRQPKSKAEAIVTAKDLMSKGLNYSAGLAQVNLKNFTLHNIDLSNVFNACDNLRAGAAIFNECHVRAKYKFGDTVQALEGALSCYYSGNFTTGTIAGENGTPSYVTKVLYSENTLNKAIPVIATETQKRNDLTATSLLLKVSKPSVIKSQKNSSVLLRKEDHSQSEGEGDSIVVF